MDKLLEKYNKSKFRKSHWASLAMLVLMVGLVALAFFLKADKYVQGRKITLIVISSILLISKTSEYIYFQIKGRREKIPMEFSQVSYYLFPISILISGKTKVVLPIGLFSAILSGFFYDISWVLFPDKFLKKDSTSQRIKALINP